MMSEISKYQRSKRAIAEIIVQLWRQSLLAFSNGNKLKIDEIHQNIDNLKQAILEIDVRLENLKPDVS